MKQILFPLISLFLFSQNLKAQTIYESAHVKDGKTVQIEVPDGYFEVEGRTSMMSMLYANQEGLNPDEMDFEDVPVGLLAIMHQERGDKTMESLKEELSEEIEKGRDEVKMIAELSTIKMNGGEFLVAGFEGNLVDESIQRMYFGTREFGDYFIMISYIATKEIEEFMSFKSFKGILESWKEVDTDKEDAMTLFADMLEYDDYEEVYETDYKNDLFETEFTYFDVFPDFGEEWDEPMDENSHLLCEFVYKTDKGSVKVFSGGSASSYPSEEEMADAIQLAMDWSQNMSLKYNSEFSNEDHLFRLYTISGGGTMTSVYASQISDEMVFFVVDGGDDPAPEFKPAVRDLMLTMWIDTYVEGDEEWEEPEVVPAPVQEK